MSSYTNNANDNFLRLRSAATLRELTIPPGPWLRRVLGLEAVAENHGNDAAAGTFKLSLDPID